MSLTSIFLVIHILIFMIMLPDAIIRCKVDEKKLFVFVFSGLLFICSFWGGINDFLV